MQITAGQILEKAAEVLEIEGWATGKTMTQDHRHCAEGALICAADKLGLNLGFRSQAFDDAILFLGMRSQAIYGRHTTFFNDEVAKDGHEVAEFIRDTAKEWFNAQ